MKATPEGMLQTSDGRTHPYLFWESALTERPLPLKDGAVVAREHVRAFLDETLRTLGGCRAAKPKTSPRIGCR